MYREGIPGYHVSRLIAILQHFQSHTVTTCHIDEEFLQLGSNFKRYFHSTLELDHEEFQHPYNVDIIPDIHPLLRPLIHPLLTTGNGYVSTIPYLFYFLVMKYICLSSIF